VKKQLISVTTGKASSSLPLFVSGNHLSQLFVGSLIPYALLEDIDLMEPKGYTQLYEKPSKAFPHLRSKLDSDQLEVVLSIQQQNFCL